MQHLKKPACVFFSFALAFSMIPAASASASPTDDDNASTDLFAGSSDLLADGSGENGTLSAQAEADVTVDSWQALQNAVNDPANNGKVIALGNDINANGGDRILIKNTTLTIDLAGHKMDRQRSDNDSDGHVIELQNSSNVTIRDSSTAKTGVITGGWASHGGGIHVGNGTTCTIEGGTIKGNKADSDGGGIYVRGTLKMTGGTITENWADDTAGGIYCRDSGTFDIENVTISNNESKNDGGGMIVHLKSDASIKNCRIINNKSKTEDGGAFRLEAGGKTLRVSDTEISGNSAENNGGGIVIYDGKLAMTGGSISNNTSEDGGGVYNDDGVIELDGVEVSGNTSTKEGGAGVNNKNDATLVNCTIKNNIGNDRGGGIYASDNITLKNCTIEGNSSTGEGGGIYAADITTNITDCTIKDNKTNESGGGIRIEDGTANISNTEIKANAAGENGGGIYVDNGGSLSLTDKVTITENTSEIAGGGLFVGQFADEVSIRGTIKVMRNGMFSGPNVYLRCRTSRHNEKYQALTLSGPLSEESSIGLTVEQELEYFSEPVTSNFSQYHPGENPALYFTTDSGYSVQEQDGEAVVCVSEWPSLQGEIDAAENGGTVTLNKNWKATPKDGALQIPEGKTITLDLNGYTVDRNCASSETVSGGEAFDVKGTLVVTDGSTAKKGKITGGNGIDGGGIHVESGGMFSLASGNISGNKARNGGGIFNEGIVAIRGGSVNGNVAEMGDGAAGDESIEENGSGAGVFNRGKLHVTGGEICGNAAADNGGGVYNAANATANLTVAVSGNIAAGQGGGVFNHGRGTLNVSDKASVKDNTASCAPNIMLAGSSVVNVVGALANGEDGAFLDIIAEIAIPDNPGSGELVVTRKLTNGLSSGGIEAASKFSYDGKAYGEQGSELTIDSNDNELVLSKTINVDGYIWVSTWSKLKEALADKDNNNKTIGLSCDIKPGPEEGSYDEILQVGTITGDGVTTALDLCGHTLDRDGKYGPVLYVGKKSSLTIKDSVGTGAITGGYNYEQSTGGIIDVDIGKYRPGGGGIVIDSNATCKIEGGSIRGNRTEKDGGGISVDGTLEMTGGGIAGNVADLSGGGIYCKDNGTIKLDGVVITNNIAKSQYGGGLNVHLDNNSSYISNCKISGNKSERDHGGGIWLNADGKTLTVNNTEISNNTAVFDEKSANETDNPEENNGGGIYVKKGTINMTGGSVQGNTAENGGGVYCKEGSIVFERVRIAGNAAVGQDYELESLFYDDETILGGHGGGVFNDETAHLLNCTIEDNTASATGGGMYVGDSDTILKDTTITGNSAIKDVSGVKADESFTVSGSTVIASNRFSTNVLLASGKKIVVGEDGLANGASIGVALEDDLGVFTKDFENRHPNGDPNKWFWSDYGYAVTKTPDGEAQLKIISDDGKHFIDLNNQITDESRLNSRNWMSGISGDRYLNEINLPCTHDSGMNKVKYHRLNSIGSFLGYAGNAKTQVRYIDEQMNDGVRRFDIRLTVYREESHYLGTSVTLHDDGKNLWLCHGKEWIGGTYWAGNHDGEYLKFTEVLDWTKEFLRKHPTEVIILDLQAEPPNSIYTDEGKDKENTYRRARIILEELNGEINPTTGKPYIYWQNGEFQDFTRYPQLKECRGQIIINCGNGVGGISDFSMGDVQSMEPNGSHGESAKDKISHTQEFYAKTNTEILRYIPLDVTEHISDRIYRASVLTAPLDNFGAPTETPLEAAAALHDALYYNGGVFDQRGQYVGWIRQDGVDAELNRYIWLSNFPESTPGKSSLHYCKVTVKSGIEPSSASDSSSVEDQEYMLLKGTQLSIPGDIYGNSKKLAGWVATVPSGSETGASTSYQQGDSYTVTSDVTFTAQWGSEEQQPKERTTKVWAVWVDGANEDGIRPDSLSFTYKLKGSTEERTGNVARGDNWSTSVDGEIAELTSVSDDEGRINPTEGAPQGQDKDGEYRYRVIHNELFGNYIALYHTPLSNREPAAGAYLSGTVEWMDDNDSADQRPNQVTLRLFADGEQVGSKKVGSFAGAWNWVFNLSRLQDYDPNTSYFVTQDPVRGYSTKISINDDGEYTITNTLVPSTHPHGLTHVDAVPAKCEESGHIEYWVCDRGEDCCNRCFSDESATHEVDPDKTQDEGGVIIPATGHEWGEWVVTKEATEAEEGVETRTCERCGETETRAIPFGIAYHYVGPADPSWTKGSADVLTLTFKRSSADEQTFGLFAGIEVDGVAVPEADSTGKANYAAESGSLVLKLQPSYLETLSVGNHQVKALFKDGSATTTVTVKATATKPASSKATTTKTGDTMPVVAIVVVAVVAALALVALLVARRRRKE